MAWQGSPTAVTAWPAPSPGRRPDRPRGPPTGAEQPGEQHRWATDVSWYSSSRTTPNCARRIRPTSGTSRARVAARAIWSPKSSRSRSRLRVRYSSTRPSSSPRPAAAWGTLRSSSLLSRAPSRQPSSSASYERSSSGATRCSDSSPSSASRSSTRPETVLVRASKGPGSARSTLAASWKRVASASSRAPGSMPSRSPCSLRSRPAKAWYVEICGSPGGVSRDRPGRGR